MKNNTASIIVCETNGHWAAGLRRFLPREALLIETRSLDELWLRLATCPAAVAALELTTGKTDPMMAVLVRIGREFPLVVTIVLAVRALSAWEDAAREAGATHFVASPRRLAEVGDIVRRRMKCLSQIVAYSDAGQSIEERILATLPWAQ